MKKFMWLKLSLLVFLCTTIPMIGMDQEKSIYEEIQSITNKNIKSVSICLGDGLTYLLEAKKANVAYPGYCFRFPVRLIPLHINDNDNKRLFTNILLPYAFLLADKCKIHTILKYNNKTCEFDMAKIDFSFEYTFPKTSSFLREVADKVELEHIIDLEEMTSSFKQKKAFNKAFLTAAHEKEVQELSLQIAQLKESKRYFMIGCAFLCVFIFFRCDWWSEREIFSF